jgi:hypothetical protein
MTATVKDEARIWKKKVVVRWKKEIKIKNAQYKNWYIQDRKS